MFNVYNTKHKHKEALLSVHLECSDRLSVMPMADSLRRASLMGWCYCFNYALSCLPGQAVRQPDAHSGGDCDDALHKTLRSSRLLVRRVVW